MKPMAVIFALFSLFPAWLAYLILSDPVGGLSLVDRSPYVIFELIMVAFSIGGAIVLWKFSKRI
jgi:hypothetical protein